VQGWFAERKLPCLVFGSRPDRLAVPRVDVDYAAAARHLAGRARTLGHRLPRTLLLTPADRLAGHVLSAEALFGPESPEGSVIGLHEDPDRAAEQVDAALARRPTLLVTQRAIHAKVVIARLWAKGLRCPGDLSLVSLQDSASLSQMRPSVTRYTVSQAALFKAATRALNRILQGESDGRSGKLLMPEMIPGETLGQAG
jgi:DNA-binding LacI/PurR family transcriptional regulator